MPWARDYHDQELVKALGLKPNDWIYAGDEDPPTLEERREEGDLTDAEYVEARAAQDHFKTLAPERRRKGVTYDEMRRDPRFRARLGIYLRVGSGRAPGCAARPRGAGRPKGRPRAQGRSYSRGGDPGDDGESEPEHLGRARYRRDLQRLLNRFGSLEAAYEWLRNRRHRPEPPPSDFWDDA
jgi:hypothetical protein